ncbi:N-6 DNA methylase [Bacillus cereus]|uniref:N-6 DNA methylase n=1 Tax=Bacillus cereus TaxID=1396 RepID=UPI001C5534FB|nr:N-6 DNA methylase [Bacillus cereus]MDA2412452.1 N-6 DNA methylase [Bacillus cereus]MDZ4434795.1 N-6 DNA methylase [Bacillus cereus]
MSIIEILSYNLKVNYFLENKLKKLLIEVIINLIQTKTGTYNENFIRYIIYGGNKMTISLKKENGKIYSHIRGKWLIETPEELVRQKYVIDLVNNYGYSLDQMDEEVRTNLPSERGLGAARADIVIWKKKEDRIKGYNSFIVIECKAENVKIRMKDFYQGTQYAANTRATFLVLHNSKETKYFNIDINKIPNTEDAFEEILAIPQENEINDEKRIRELLTQTKTFTRDEFTKLLVRCHNIIRNNDKLSPEAAFDEISKILFIKINYEKHEHGREVFTLKKYQENQALTEKYNQIHRVQNPLPYMQQLFLQTKENYKDDHLFEENEMLKIKENSFEAILKELQKYNLSDTSDDVKGIAFEEFLGKTFRGELGQFFTPRTIVDFMAHVLDPKEGETICDPACGSGGFLIKAFEYVREQIERDIQKEKDKFKNELLGEDFENLAEFNKQEITQKVNKVFVQLNKELESFKKDSLHSRLHFLSHDCIYGTDANPRMARVSKMNMIMHGDGHGGVHRHDGLLNINGIFEERFDVILTNPPFGSRVDKDLLISKEEIFDDKEAIKRYKSRYGEAYQQALDSVKDNVGKPIINMFDIGKFSGLTEVLFMERCLKLLKKGGRMGIVLPEGVLNNPNLQKVRDYFEGRAKIVLICSIPQDVFIAAGASVKPSIVFMKRFTEEEEKKYSEVVNGVTSELGKKYGLPILKKELEKLEQADIKNKRDKIRIIRNKIKEVEKIIDEEQKPLIKECFDYNIPIAKVDKAGITTTGAKCENELEVVEIEFKKYNETARLWTNNSNEVSYTFSSDGNLVRTINQEERVLSW